MKKVDFIFVAIIFVGIWSLYEGIVYAVYLLISLVSLAINDFRYSTNGEFLISNILLTAMYCIIAFLALRRTGQVITFLGLGPGEQESKFLEAEPTGKPFIQKHELLYIVIIGTGIFMLVPAISGLAERFIGYFQQKVDRYSTGTGEFSLALPFIKVAVPVILLLLAKRIAGNAFSQ